MLPVIRRASGTSAPGRWLDQELDRLFNGYWVGVDRTPTGPYPVDVWEDDDNVYVEAEVPGFSKDEISITLERGILHISTERKPVQTKGNRPVNERTHGRVHRSFTLPKTVDDTKAQARLDSGVLQLTFPKRAEVKPQKINIS